MVDMILSLYRSSVVILPSQLRQVNSISKIAHNTSSNVIFMVFLLEREPYASVFEGFCRHSPSKNICQASLLRRHARSERGPIAHSGAAHVVPYSTQAWHTSPVRPHQA